MSDVQIRRLIIGSLLGSEIPLAAVRAFAQELQRSPRSAEQLGRAIVAAVDGIEGLPGGRRGRPDPRKEIGASADVNRLLLKAAQTRKMAGSSFVAFARSVDELPNWQPGPALTLRQAIASFVGAAPPGVAAEVLSRLAGAPATDPYLSGLQAREPR